MILFFGVVSKVDNTDAFGIDRLGIPIDHDDGTCTAAAAVMPPVRCTVAGETLEWLFADDWPTAAPNSEIAAETSAAVAVAEADVASSTNQHGGDDGHGEPFARTKTDEAAVAAVAAAAAAGAAAEEVGYYAASQVTAKTKVWS